MNRTTCLRRDADLALIDKILDDARCLRDEARVLDSMRSGLNEAPHPLTDAQRDYVVRISKSVEARPPSERPSGVHPLDQLPRPLRPPTAIARSA